MSALGQKQTSDQPPRSVNIHAPCPSSSGKRASRSAPIGLVAISASASIVLIADNDRTLMLFVPMKGTDGMGIWGSIRANASPPTSSTRPRSSAMDCPDGDGCAARPQKRAKRLAASPTSATTIVMPASPSAPFGCVSQRGCHTVCSVWCVRILNAPFRHFGGLDTRNREGRRSWPGASIDRTLQLNERPYAKAILGKAAVVPRQHPPRQRLQAALRRSAPSRYQIHGRAWYRRS